MRYSEVLFTCKGGEAWQRDLLMQELADIGFDSFEEQDDGFAAYIATEQLDIPLIETLLIQQPPGFEVSYMHREIPPVNWNKEWEKNFKPVVISDQCYVRASFHTPQPRYRYEIVIDPKMAFGTGHHQTTSLMMRYMLEASFAGKKVLDMGCGTGILAILAAKLGAMQVLAVDNDPACVASVDENRKLNGVEHIEAMCGTTDLIAGMQFDIILANINRNILLDQLNSYAQCLKIGGELYMSGFYDGDDLSALQKAGMEHALEYREHHTLDEWAAARFTKIK